MAYYNYHARTKQLIQDVGVDYCEFVNNYPRIGEALVIYFKCGEKRPIRPHRYIEYKEIIEKYLNQN